jgi:hypothetical protein
LSELLVAISLRLGSTLNIISSKFFNCKIRQWAGTRARKTNPPHSPKKSPLPLFSKEGLFFLGRKFPL